MIGVSLRLVRVHERRCLFMCVILDRASPTSHMYDSEADFPKSCLIASSRSVSCFFIAFFSLSNASRLNFMSKVLPDEKNFLCASTICSMFIL